MGGKLSSLRAFGNTYGFCPQYSDTQHHLCDSSWTASTRMQQIGCRSHLRAKPTLGDTWQQIWKTCVCVCLSVCTISGKWPVTVMSPHFLSENIRKVKKTWILLYTDGKLAVVLVIVLAFVQGRCWYFEHTKLTLSYMNIARPGEELRGWGDM